MDREVPELCVGWAGGNSKSVEMYQKNCGTCWCLCIYQPEEWPGNNEAGGESHFINTWPYYATEDHKPGKALSPPRGQFYEVETHSSVPRVVLRTPGFLRRTRTKPRWPAQSNSSHPALCHSLQTVGQRLRTGSKLKHSQL